MKPAVTTGRFLPSGRVVVFRGRRHRMVVRAECGTSTEDADPTHLPLPFTHDVLSVIGKDIFKCCVMG